MVIVDLDASRVCVLSLTHMHFDKLLPSCQPHWHNLSDTIPNLLWQAFMRCNWSWAAFTDFTFSRGNANSQIVTNQWFHLWFLGWAVIADGNDSKPRLMMIMCDFISTFYLQTSSILYWIQRRKTASLAITHLFLLVLSAMRACCKQSEKFVVLQVCLVFLSRHQLLLLLFFFS